MQEDLIVQSHRSLHFVKQDYNIGLISGLYWNFTEKTVPDFCRESRISQSSNSCL